MTNAVYTAVGHLMAHERPDRITIPMVAERAGVNPTSIYRRWGDVDELLKEVAVAVLAHENDVLPDTGTLAGDLTEWAELIADDIGRPERGRYLRALASARDDLVEFCPCWNVRGAQAARLIERAQERGDAVPTVDQVLDHIIGPLYHHAVFALPVTTSYARRLVGDVLLMAQPATS